MEHNPSNEKLSLAAHESGRGDLYVGETGKEIPFAIKRFYIIANVPRGDMRANHAHKETVQAVFCLHGSCDVVLDDGKNKERHVLDSVSKGVLLLPLVWHTLENISKDAKILVVASDYYDESDYIRDHAEFKKYVS